MCSCLIHALCVIVLYEYFHLLSSVIICLMNAKTYKGTGQFDYFYTECHRLRSALLWYCLKVVVLSLLAVL